jgi:Raf kinase inhibitor-like YbhB/YbcL family protein
MELTSTAFEHEGNIPSRYTCDGDNVNPPLKFRNVPENTVCLVLIMEDPDVPKYIREDGLWVHWVVFNIPNSVSSIRQKSQPEGVPGSSTRNTLTYGGPCPPDGEHRYFFKLYALNSMLELPQGANKKNVEKAMQGLIIEQCELIGKYQRVQSNAL